MKPELTAEYVRECLDYNPDTGIFTWKFRPRSHFSDSRIWSTWNTRFSGTEAGSNQSGYTCIKLLGKERRAHRLAWLISIGEWPTKFIDHRNGLKNDNRLVNLRDANRSENGFNAKLSSFNTSGVKGISWDKNGRRWQARVCINRKSIYLGRFNSIDCAKEAIQEARLKLHGEFAHHG